MKIFNGRDTREKRINLRKNQTDAEKILWSKLRNKQMNGLKFFRQYGIGHYITDFYCPNIKLAVEIDGNQHFAEEGKEYDSVREKIFSSLGIMTLRFTNIEVLKQLDSVLGKVRENCPSCSNSP